jgi:chloramphenicol 3-O phosphotransferase
VGQIEGETMTATIVLLNGVGSAGKSSITRALQRIASRPFLHVAMDTFLDMLPPPFLNHPDGLQLTPTANGVAIHAGPVVQRLLDGMRRAIASRHDAP